MQTYLVSEPVIVPVFEDRTHQWLSYFEAARLFAHQIQRESLGGSTAPYSTPQSHAGYPQAQSQPNSTTCPYPAYNQPPASGYGQAPQYNPYPYRQQQPNLYPQPYGYNQPPQPNHYPDYGPPSGQQGYYPAPTQATPWGQVSYPTQPYAAPPASGYPPQPMGQYSAYPGSISPQQPQVYQYSTYEQTNNYNYGFSPQPVEKTTEKKRHSDEKVTPVSYHVQSAPSPVTSELGQQNLSIFLDEDIKSFPHPHYEHTQPYYSAASSQSRTAITEDPVVAACYKRDAYAPGIGTIGWNI